MAISAPPEFLSAFLGAFATAMAEQLPELQRSPAEKHQIKIDKVRRKYLKKKLRLAWKQHKAAAEYAEPNFDELLNQL